LIPSRGKKSLFQSIQTGSWSWPLILLSNTQVKNEWNFITAPPCAFLVCTGTTYSTTFTAYNTQRISVKTATAKLTEAIVN
jgi:hypothetical protein